MKPTMLDQSYYETANEIISRYPLEEKSLIPIIQDIQATYRYLPPDLLDYVAKKIGITETKAYSVASFYENFSFEQKGKYVLKICDGTACHVRKSTPVLQYLRQELGLSETKQTTDDLMFTVEVVSCLGACGLAPAMMVNEQVHPKMTPEKAAELLKELRAKEEEGRNWEKKTGNACVPPFTRTESSLRERRVCAGRKPPPEALTCGNWGRVWKADLCRGFFSAARSWT